jgi:hypothetical protein
MTRNEAKQALKEGKKLTHKYFTSDEWIIGLNDGNYMLEDGVKCTPAEFWKWRTDSAFDNDWEIYNE